MRKYFHVVGIGIQNTLVYRVNFLFRAVFGLIPLLGVIQLWRAVYTGKASGAEIAGYSLAHMISYYLIVTIVDAFTAVAEDDWQIAADIKDGNISQFMIKPIDYLGYRLCIFASGRMMYTLVAAIPVGIFIFVQRQYFVLPSGWTALGAFTLSLVLTALLQFFISYTMALLAFWVLEVSTFIFILFALEYLAGGHMFPLDILPPVIEKALYFTPFPYQMYFPVSIYLGQSTGADLWQGLAIQTGWVVAMFAVARLVWSRGLKRYSAVGG